MGELFGTDGIRGRAGEYPITEQIAQRIGAAVAQVFASQNEATPRVVIGRDTRVSGPMLESALRQALLAGGVDVLALGIVPTPAVAYLTKSLGADAGIMLTASHNPADDNGIKIFRSDGFKLSDELEAQIEALILAEEMPEAKQTTTEGRVENIENACGLYLEFVHQAVGHCSLDGLKIALDCANGAAYQAGPAILKQMGAEVFSFFTECDGQNINAGCGATQTDAIAARVHELGADIGIAFDGDADRVLFCDAKGQLVDGDRILAICAKQLQAAGKLSNDTLVVTTMSNLGLHDAMQAVGITVEVTDVGDRQVIECMRRDGFCLGGEKSGHVIFMDHSTTGDGILTALQVLKLMRESKQTLETLADCMEEYPQRLTNIMVLEKKPLDNLPKVQQVMEACRQSLGSEGRTILRYSGTEKMIRILVEARSEEQVSHWTDNIRAVVVEELC